VHPAIKKVLCEQAGKDRIWLAKVRPWWGHFYHFHVRITCPPGSGGCEAQKPVSGDDGCGTELFKKLRQAEMHPAQPGKPVPGKPPLALDDLPKECRTVLPGGGTLRFCLLQTPLSISPGRPAASTSQLMPRLPQISPELSANSRLWRGECAVGSNRGLSDGSNKHSGLDS